MRGLRGSSDVIVRSSLSGFLGPETLQEMLAAELTVSQETQPPVPTREQSGQQRPEAPLEGGSRLLGGVLGTALASHCVGCGVFCSMTDPNPPFPHSPGFLGPRLCLGESCVSGGSFLSGSSPGWKAVM